MYQDFNPNRPINTTKADLSWYAYMHPPKRKMSAEEMKKRKEERLMRQKRRKASKEPIDDRCMSIALWAEKVIKHYKNSVEIAMASSTDSAGRQIILDNLMLSYYKELAKDRKFYFEKLPSTESKE